jgi:hypothetical protein
VKKNANKLAAKQPNITPKRNFMRMKRDEKSCEGFTGRIFPPWPFYGRVWILRVGCSVFSSGRKNQTPSR